MPLYLDEIYRRLEGADLFVAIGTSGQVYPAAGFVAAALEDGARALEINLDPSDTSLAFEDRLLGPATETVPAWVSTILD